MKTEYRGAFYYSPQFLLNYCKNRTDKKLAIILNEKEVNLQDLDELLDPCKNIIQMVRLAVAPSNLSRVVDIAENIKSRGFLVSVNLMYASKWEQNLYLEESFRRLNSVLDYFYVVDSYGSMHPSEVQEVFEKLRGAMDVKLGFHGHNNIEMALINSLTALDSGATIIDGTVCGMGRGAGNLKTELYLTVLHKKYNLKVDFDILNDLSNSFTNLKKKYGWGTNLPYMVSGAYSLPQNEVMGQVKKRFYSLNSIISEVQDVATNKEDFKFSAPAKKLVNQFVLVGGGQSPQKFYSFIREYLKQNPEMGIIHSSSKNLEVFRDLKNFQIHCIGGMEMDRLKNKLFVEQMENRIFIVSQERYSALNFAEKFKQNIRFLPKGHYQTNYTLSTTAMAMDIVNYYKAKKIMLIGYDGYDQSATKEQLELFNENQSIFDSIQVNKLKVSSLTSTKYDVNTNSIFSLI
ncbi:hypothetical protein [Autumnicola patrickiae]|uniref:hypothetical protein n=1 Tax=Autumnicola patrickiae TaxID=3075591 RepID=UPI003D789402